MRTHVVLSLIAVLVACERPDASEPGEPVVTKSERADAPAAANDSLTTVKVTERIHMLVGRGGNIGVLVGDDGVLMVDDKFAPMAPAIKKAIATISGGKPIRYLVNTHHHGDHTGGNAEFSTATIVAHDNVRKRLVADKKPKAGYPVITFDSATTLHFAGETVKVRHYANGHTDGDSVLFFTESKVVHMGDHFFHGRFPFIDLNSGGHPKALLANIDNLLETIPADATIIPGHGALATVADLRTYRTMLADSIDHVAKQLAKGASLAAIKKNGVPAKYAGWGSGFVTDDRWLETLANALK